MTVLLDNRLSKRESAQYVSSATAPYQQVAVSGSASRGAMVWPRAEMSIQAQPALSDWGEWIALSRHGQICGLATRFARRVKAILEVQAVTLDLGGDEPRIVTYIERRDLDVRHRVYEVEDEVCAESPGLQVDFHVVSLDAPGAAVPAATVAGATLLMRR